MSWNPLKESAPFMSKVKKRRQADVPKRENHGSSRKKAEPPKQKAERTKSKGKAAKEVGSIQLPSDQILPEQASGVRESLEEKYQLRQSIAGTVGGPTGLLAALDAMVYDTDEKNPVGFRSHAEGYLWRLEQLQAHLKRYREITTEELESAPLYNELLHEGDALRKLLQAPELTDDDLDRWRERMLQHIDLYVDEEEDDHEP